MRWLVTSLRRKRTNCNGFFYWSGTGYFRWSQIGSVSRTPTYQSSFAEQAIFFYVSKAFEDAINRYNEHNVEIDIFIPSLMIGIEYDGSRYHKKVEKDIAKNEICCKRGIQLVHIREFDCPTINCDKKC